METRLIGLVKDEDINFSKLERIMWQSLIEVFQHIMVEFLESTDQNLMAIRDVKRYKLKEKNSRTIQTMVGPVTFKRRYYWDNEKAEWVYLLDQRMGLERDDRVSAGLAELAVIWATKGPSYRDARDRLSDLYGSQVLSHEAIRQILLEVAAYAEKEDERAIREVQGTQEVDALFIEIDGFNSYLQNGDSRKRKRREPKLAVVHEGWEVRQGTEPNADYRLVSPMYVPVLGDSKEFSEYLRGRLSAKYKDIDKVPVIINGDEASWIRATKEVFAKGYYQYDRFHLSRALNDALRHDTKRLKVAKKALRNDDITKLAIVVAEALREATDPKVIEKISSFLETVVEHQEAIRDYRKRLREDGYIVAPGWRSMGAAESNVDKFKNRICKQGRAWSEIGLQSILTTLAKLYEGILPEYISRNVQELEEWVLDRLETGAGQLAKKIKSANVGVRHGSFPATQRGTEGYAELFRDILRPVSP